jgi:hypothetical protein
MSSKSRARNLALLGGLGAAAMMAMKGRKKGEDKEDKKTSVAAPAGPQTYADMPRGEKVLSEIGEDSGFRRNPETGDLYRDVLGDMRTRAQESADDEKIFRATGVRPRPAMKKGGAVKKMAAGGSVSKRADGCAVKGKTRGRMI